MPVVVVATIRPLPDHREEVEAAFRDAVAAVHAEDGCELYALHGADDRLVMLEQWTSGAALDAHMTSDALQLLGPRIADKLAEPVDVVRLDPLPAGHEQKGRLRP